MAEEQSQAEMPPSVEASNAPSAPDSVSATTEAPVSQTQDTTASASVAGGEPSPPVGEPSPPAAEEPSTAVEAAPASPEPVHKEPPKEHAPQPEQPEKSRSITQPEVRGRKSTHRQTLAARSTKFNGLQDVDDRNGLYA